MEHEININNLVQRDNNFSTRATTRDNASSFKATEQDVANVEESQISQRLSATENTDEDKKSLGESVEEVTEEQIEEALETVSDFLSNSYKHVGFSSDDSLGRTIIKVTDKQTQELISQFPSEKALEIAAKIKNLHTEVEDVSGLLLDKHV